MPVRATDASPLRVAGDSHGGVPLQLPAEGLNMARRFSVGVLHWML